MVTTEELLRLPRADSLAASDDAHEKYYESGVPIPSSTRNGKGISKSVNRTTTYCPDCEVPARKHDGENVCPGCGLICQGKDSEAKPLVIDPKAAGRVNGSTNGGTANT